MPIARRVTTAIVLTAAVVVAGHAARHYWFPIRSAAAGAAPTAIATGRRPDTIETEHYTIASTAARTETLQVAAAVESLFVAYAAFFPDPGASERPRPRLRLVLYRDQQEFKRHNRSSPWAEAFYLAPECHAYYAAGQPNPYHWMVHEATHQLNTEVAHLKKTKWIDEGLASYFGASQLRDGTLVPGSIDANTYPIWWLPSLALSGDVDADVRAGRIIPLRDVIQGTGPDIGQHVNQYYIEFWSLSHFLFHYNDGQYAQRYRQLIAAGGSLENFERLIGPVESVQHEWYAHLQRVRGEVVGAPRQGEDRVPVVPARS